MISIVNKRIAIIALQTIFCSKPKKTLIVLKDRTYVSIRQAVGSERRALVSNAAAKVAMRGDADEARLRLLEIAEHRVAEHFVAPARLAARVRSWLWPRRFEIDQLLRFRDRQRSRRAPDRAALDPVPQGSPAATPIQQPAPR